MLFGDYVTTLSVSRQNDVEWEDDINDELERIWIEVVVAYSG
jgi:hypothetical protein